MATIELTELVIDVPADRGTEVQDFYQFLTGYTLWRNADGPGLLENPDGMDLGVQVVSDEYRAPTWPTQERGQQLHIDFATDDIEAAVALAESMGAKRAPDQGDHGWVVMLDPVGHPFCFVQHRDVVDGERRLVREDGPSIKLRGPYIDCPDQHALAEFYLGLLGGQIIMDPDDEYLVMVTATGRPLAFQRVEGYQPPTWPTQERGQQMHFDMKVDDPDAARELAESLGATLAYDGADEKKFMVMMDPAGHPFCFGWWHGDA